MLKPLHRRLTVAQRTRRDVRIARRLSRSTAPVILNAPAMPRRVSQLLRYMQSSAVSVRAFLRRERAANLKTALDLAGRVEAAFARLRARRAPHCPHQYRSFGTIDRRGRRLRTDACGGKLRRDALGRLVCTACGRGWRSIGAKQLVAA